MLLRFEQLLTQLTYIFILFIHISSSFEQDIIPGWYRKHSIEEDRICSPITKRKWELGDNFALFITQTRTKDHTTTWTKNVDCKFKVTSNHNNGVVAVIQNLKFRINSTTGECIDFIQFKTKRGRYSSKICGDLKIENSKIEENSFFPADFHDLTFIDYEGKLETTIFISREKLQPSQNMDLNIVYTEFQKCKMGQPLLIPCSPSDGRNICLFNMFFGDKIVNCPHQGCVDEEDCSKIQNFDTDKCLSNECLNHGPSTNTKVTLGAVATLVLFFIVFIFCVWFCRKTGTICWAHDCVSPPTERQRTQPSRVIEMQNRVEVPPEGATPSAPDADKDLPPSYDSLFPQR